MKLTNHKRKTIVTDLYTVEENKKTYYFIRHTNGKGKLIFEELRTQRGKVIQKNSLIAEAQQLIQQLAR